MNFHFEHSARGVGWPANRRGFTLIELLASLAIIALLSLITVPMIKHAMHSARGSLSASNLRNWGTAFHYSLVDSEGWMPSRGPGEQPSWIQVSNYDDIEAREAWYNLLPPYVREMNLSAIEATGDPDGALLKDRTIHRDPMAKLQRAQLEQRPVFSYSMNERLNTSLAHGDIVPGQGDLRAAILRFSMYEEPTSTVLLFESRVNEEDGQTQGDNTQYGRAYGDQQHISFRRGETVQALFLDGSVRKYESATVYAADPDAQDVVRWSGLP
jgi:prepilin-type N-terminal cleavage/methylation domain-containing protein